MEGHGLSGPHPFCSRKGLAPWEGHGSVGGYVFFWVLNCSCDASWVSVNALGSAAGWCGAMNRTAWVYPGSSFGLVFFASVDSLHPPMQHRLQRKYQPCKYRNKTACAKRKVFWHSLRLVKWGAIGRRACQTQGHHSRCQHDPIRQSGTISLFKLTLHKRMHVEILEGLGGDE